MTRGKPQHPRFSLHMPRELIRAIDSWRGVQEGVPSRAEAIRWLVEDRARTSPQAHRRGRRQSSSARLQCAASSSHRAGHVPAGAVRQRRRRNPWGLHAREGAWHRSASDRDQCQSPIRSLMKNREGDGLRFCADRDEVKICGGQYWRIGAALPPR